jgi:nitrile hydratase accessory protein
MRPAPTEGPLPNQPWGDEGPVFNEPWEAHAFAIVLKLHEAGCFTWNEWTEHLSAEIEAARARGDPDLGDTYYGHWLAALEKISADKNLLLSAELRGRKAAWAKAFRETPHGQPVTLPPHGTVETP